MKRIIISFAVLAIVALGSCTRIDSGNEALKVNQYGNDKGDAIPIPVRGTVWYNPFTEDVYEYPTFMRHISYKDVVFNAKGGSIFTANPTFNYKMKKGRAVAVFINYRKSIEDIEQEYIMSSVQDSYVRVGNTYSPDSLMSSRASFEDKVMKELTTKLGEDFTISQLVSNTTPPASLIEAIDYKNKLVQEGLAEQNKVVKATATANVAIENARGTAESLRIQADADAYANRVRQVSLTPMLIQQQFIDKWDGALPTYGQVPQLFKDISK